MAKELTDILLDAIKANDELVALTGSRVFDTSVEVPDWQDNNTKCPYLVVIEDPYQNELGTKDSVWEGSVDHCGAYIVICADTPDDVGQYVGNFAKPLMSTWWHCRIPSVRTLPLQAVRVCAGIRTNPATMTLFTISATWT